MEAPLTLHIDEDLIRKAEVWASQHGTSVSNAVAEFFARLPSSGSSDGSWLRQISGIAAHLGHKSDQDVREEYAAYLDEKYR